MINKSDLAPHVGADLDRMIKDSEQVRMGRRVLVTNCRIGSGIEAVADVIMHEVLLR